MSKLYRQITLTDDQRNVFFLPHKIAMTSENLHSKSEVAYELGARDMRIAELEKELDNLNSGTDDLYNMVFEHVGLKLEFPDEVDHTDIKQLLKAHNLEVRKQAFTDAVKYMEHSDKLITTHDVEIFIAEVDVYLSDKAGKS